MKTIVAILLVLFATRSAFAMASTDVIEGPMEAQTAALYGFPDNALTLINDWHRVYAWHPWFSELPNATYYFAFNAPTMSHVNELLGYFGELKAKELTVDLSPAESDFSVQHLFNKKAEDRPEVGPVTLILSSQKDLDQWFDHLDENGKKTFHVKDRPVASAPTLVIYVGNKIIDLDQLKLPVSVKVKTTIYDDDRKDPKLAKTIERIEKFVESHARPR